MSKKIRRPILKTKKMKGKEALNATRDAVKIGIPVKITLDEKTGIMKARW